MTSPGVRASGDEVLVEVQVVPRASRNELAGWGADGRLRVRITASPVEGQANRALLKVMSRALGVPAGRLRVVRGQTSRRKTIAVSGADITEVVGSLGGANS